MRKMIVVMLTILAIATACPKQERNTGAPAAVPEQSAPSPAAGQDVTAEYLQTQLDNYIRYRDRIFEDAKKRIAANEDPNKVYDALLKELIALQKATDDAVEHAAKIGDSDLVDMFEQDKKTLRQITGGASEY